MDNFKTDNELIVELGQKLKKIRVNLNFTQSAVAKQTGIDRVTISKIENGTPTSLRYLFKLMRMYNKIDGFMNVFYLPDLSPMEVWKAQKKQKKYATKTKQ